MRPLLQSKQDYFVRLLSSAIYKRCLTRTSSLLRRVFVRLSWTKTATAAHTLHLRWQKSTLKENK